MKNNTLLEQDSTMNVRVSVGLRLDFLKATKANDDSAARVIRAFMRKYCAENITANQIK